jgi:hypothetical protein
MRQKCQSDTAQGRPCSRYALPGKDVCGTHAGAPVGRPSKLTPETANRVVSVLRAGGYTETAASVAGVNTRRLREWMARGDPEGTDPRNAPYREFAAAVTKARAESEARNVAIITRAAGTNWQAAAWLLERTHPERWARPAQRVAAEPEPAPGVTEVAPDDPFAEVDELAQRRQRDLRP